jgi:hypothetical protein
MNRRTSADALNREEGSGFSGRPSYTSAEVLLVAVTIVAVIGAIIVVWRCI